LRKRLLRSLSLTLVPAIAALIIKLLFYSSKKVYHLPKEMPDEPVLFVFWHGDLLMQPFLYNKLRVKPKAKVIISDHFDGQIIAKTMQNYSPYLESIHGSSTRNGAKVLINALKDIRVGYDIAITPDGPKGPRHEVKDGVVTIAQKSKTKVIVFSLVPKRYWQFKSWDRFTIPKPFTQLDFYASEPLDLTGMTSEEAKALIKEKLLVYDY